MIARRLGARGPWVFLLPACVVAVAAVALASPWTAFSVDPAARVQSDFQILHAAGRGMVVGRDIHDPVVLDELGRVDGREHTPFCAANPLVVRLFGVAAEQPLDVAYGRALAVGVLLALTSLALLAAVLYRAGASRVAALILALAALGLPEALWMSLAMNSTNLLALTGVLLALWAAVCRRPVLEGLGLALAVVAKTSPALLLLVVALSGRRRVALAGAASLLGVAAVSVAWTGWPVHQSWIERVLPALGYAPDLAQGAFNNSLHAWNLAPNGFLSRALLGAGGPRVGAWLGAWAVTALVLTQLVSALRSEPSPRGGGVHARRCLWEYALGLAAMLLVSSVTWPHHLVLLSPCIGCVLLALTTATSEPARPVGPVVGAPAAGAPSHAALGLAVASLVLLALPLGVLDVSAELAREGPLRTAALVVLFAALTRLAPRSDSPPEAAD